MKSAKKEILIIEPMGGICNRLRAIHSAAFLASRLGRRLEIVWLVNGELGARFDELFQPLPAVGNVKNLIRNEPTELQRIQYHLHRFASHWFSGRYLDASEIKDMAENKSDLTSMELSDRCYIKSWSPFLGFEEPFLNFEPVVSLRNRIDKISKKFGRTVGVHIRRTDNLTAIEESPTSAILKALEHDIDRNPDTTIFLATDDLEEKHAVLKQFGGRVICAETQHYERSNVDAIKDALVELYCLAACDRIIGSAGSTFSTTAARIGGAQLSIVRR